MRCKKEEFIKNQYFHFYNHAVENGLLFREDDDYLWFLDKFNLKLEKYPTSVFAYCLMPNHFHFLLRQESDKPIYQIFNDLNNSYVPHYNFKYKRKGRLYREPLQHIHIKKENYLIYLCQYIHYNPVKAGLVKELEDWKYSNYPEWIGLRNGKLYNNELLLAYFGNPREYKKQIKEHEKYMKEKEFGKLLFD
ncbi:MAG TPA: hypothetical protein ENL20_06405 [Candidatus Cloacimonetes bacterium]|nr:hypothetical protein [Candidatus Cloacimonadota bacterium]